MIKFSPSSLYKASRFADTFTRNQLQQLIEKQWSWRNVSFLCQEQVSNDVRKDIMHRVAEGELEQGDVKEAIDKELGITSQKAKTRNLVQALDKITSMSQSFHGSLEDVDVLVTSSTRCRPTSVLATQSRPPPCSVSWWPLEKDLKARILALKEIKF
jgi:DNA-directed RNA polymerase sigma subunit (sigma70/sigma32)